MACKINEYISKLEKSLPDIHDRLNKKYMPEFDKLPTYIDGQRNLTVATVGSRETPPDILEKMTSIGKYLSNKGYTMQSGGAIGADMAFEGKTYPKILTAKNEVKNKKGEIVLNAGETAKIGTKRFTDAYYVFSSKDNKGQIQASEWVKNTPAKNVTSFSSFDITYNKFGNAGRAKIIANEVHPSEKQLSTWPEALMGRNTYQVFGKNLDKPVDFVLFYAEETDDPLRPKGGTGQAVEMARRKGVPTINMADKDWKKQLDDIVNKKAKTEKSSPDTQNSSGGKVTQVKQKSISSVEDLFKKLYEDAPDEDMFRDDDKGTDIFLDWLNNNKDLQTFLKNKGLSLHDIDIDSSIELGPDPDSFDYLRVLENNLKNSLNSKPKTPKKEEFLTAVKKPFKTTAKILKKPEIIKTIIDGEEETSNKGKVGDYVITGPKDEEYIIKKENLTSKYNIDSKNDNILNLSSKPVKIKYKIATEDMKFKASWGEDMIAHPGDSLIYENGKLSYRIEKEAFNKTYESEQNLGTMTLKERKQYEEQMANKAVKEGC